MRPYDLVVVGGGPAGSTLAALAKKHNPGRRVLLLEREAFPRHHVGESTLPGMVPILEELGVADKVRAAGFPRKVGAAYVRRGQRPWTVPLRDERWSGPVQDIPGVDYSWQVLRSRYDKILLDHARELGVEVRERAAVSAVRLGRDGAPSRLSLSGPGRPAGEVEAGLLADCSGQSGLLNRLLGVRSRIRELSNLAVYAYYRGDPFRHSLSGSPEATRISIRYVDDGWLWYIPLAPDLVSVGFVCNRDTLRRRPGGDLLAFYESRLRRSRAVRDALRGAERVLDFDGTGRGLFTAQDYSYRNRRGSGDGWIAAGDAAYFVDPIISSGVFMAHMTGMRAAYAVGTTWRSPDPDLRRLAWDDYNAFVRQLSGAFIQMARFWYSPEHDARGWCRLAGRLSVGGPAPAVSRLRSFVRLTSGLFPYRSSVLEDASYWTNARMTLSVLAGDRAGRLERLEALPPSPRWRPRLLGRYRTVRSTVMRPGTGLVVPALKVRFEPPGPRGLADLQPLVPVTPLHLQVLEGVRRGSQVAALVRRASSALSLPEEAAGTFVLRFLQELKSAGYVR